MEKAGGHTLEKHVSKANQILDRRAAKDAMVQAASTFTDKKTAINAVQENLRHHAEEIAAWLQNNPTAPKSFDFSHKHPIGKSVPKKNPQVIYNITQSRIVLVKDSTLNFGFKIITAFPINK